MTTRIEVDLKTGKITEIALTAKELEQAAIAYSLWQNEENIRIAEKKASDARQAKFEEWLKTQ